MNRTLAWFVLGVCVGSLVACGSDGPTGRAPSGGGTTSGRVPLGAVSCGTTKEVFRQSPVAISDIIGWVPLGTMSPPGHTFPTDHQYIYVSNPTFGEPRHEVNIVAPGDMIITKAHLGTTTPGGSDYTIEFSPCAQVYGQFGHVLTIAPGILGQLGAFDQYCNTYSPSPGSSVSTCESKFVTIKVRAGDVIGTAGGPSPHSLALDFWLWDARVPSIAYANPGHWPVSTDDRFDSFHVVAASEYFAEPANSAIAPHVGSYDGLTRRTALPPGGTIAVDVPGTMMGFWFNPSQPSYPETVHLAIAPDNVFPNRIILSIGLSQPGWNLGYGWFAPTDTGTVNRNPAQITADGRIYCFESPGSWAVLGQLIDATTVRMEYVQHNVTTCAQAQPWTFTAAKFDYTR
ncbi:MAG: hypothetical protein ABI205_11520 [Gemmatimonadaceae bacterium]